MNVRSLAELRGVLIHAKNAASKKDPRLEEFSEIARRSGVKVTTLQSWFLGTHEPRALKLAAVASVLQVPMDRLVYSGSRNAFEKLGIVETYDTLKDTERAHLAGALVCMIETANLAENPAEILAAFERQIRNCAEMCKRLH